MPPCESRVNFGGRTGGYILSVFLVIMKIVFEVSFQSSERAAVGGGAGHNPRGRAVRSEVSVFLHALLLLFPLDLFFPNFLL